MIATDARRKERAYFTLPPATGVRLRARRIAVLGLGAVAGAAERLADRGVLRWQLGDAAVLGPGHPLVRLWGREYAGLPAGEAFAHALRARDAWEGGWLFGATPILTPETYPALRQALVANRPHLLLGGGDADSLHLLGRLARDLDLPAVLVACLPAPGPRSAVLALLPGDGGHGRDVPDLLRVLGAASVEDPAAAAWPAERWLDWQDANAVAALVALALLLQGSPAAPPDLSRLLVAEHRTAILQGTADWPWVTRYLNLATETLESVSTPEPLLASLGALSGGPVLIAGCGSLGSQVARTLIATRAAHALILVDGGVVAAEDRATQFYRSDQVGRHKADALAEQLLRLAPGARGRPSWTPALFSETWNGLTRSSGDWAITQIAQHPAPHPWFEAMLASLRPAAAVLTIGGPADAALAGLLRELGMPHVEARPAADGTYIEALLTDGCPGSGLACPGPAAFAAEPTATAIDTGRAADVIARLAWQLSLPVAARAPWFARHLGSGQGTRIGITRRG